MFFQRHRGVSVTMLCPKQAADGMLAVNTMVEVVARACIPFR